MQFLVEYTIKNSVRGSEVVEAKNAAEANRKAMEQLFDAYPKENEISVRVLKLG